ncbi:MAG TPA: hypothetical protein VF756_27435 [Thermoanaerobaculia bacterium]
MRGRTARVGVAVALLGILLTSCGRGYRQVVVIDGDKAEFVTFGRAPQESQEILAPGRVLVFRTSSAVPGSTKGLTGTAGHVYRVTDTLEMEDLGEFDPTIPNDTLAYRYGG